MNKPTLFILTSLGLCACSAQAAMNLTFVQGVTGTQGAAGQQTGVTSQTIYTNPTATQPSWAQPQSANDPGMYHGHEIAYSSSVATTLSLNASGQTPTGRIDISLESAVQTFTVEFAYNRDIGSHSSLSASAMRLNQGFSNALFAYGIDLEMISGQNTLQGNFGGTTPTSSDWYTPSTGADWNSVGSGLSIDGLTGANTLNMTMAQASLDNAGMNIVDQTRGDANVLSSGWRVTFDAGAGNTFSAGDSWRFTFDGTIPLAERVPEPSTAVLTLLSGLAFIIRRSRNK